MFKFWVKKFFNKQNIAVLGLGSFGKGVVETLLQHKVNILACDSDENQVKEIADLVTHAVTVDLADEAALKSLGLGNFDVVIVASCEEFEATQIAAMVAREEGAKHIVVKASNLRQKTILEKIGVDEIILPEYEMGCKIAKRLADPGILSMLEESNLYHITELNPRPEWIGKTIREADIRRASNITILATYRDGKFTVPVHPDWRIEEKDILLVFSDAQEERPIQ